MRRTIRENPGEVTLIAVGPMTNIALLFLTDPEIPHLLKRLCLMCGRFGTFEEEKRPHADLLAFIPNPGPKPYSRLYGHEFHCGSLRHQNRL